MMPLVRTEEDSAGEMVVMTDLGAAHAAEKFLCPKVQAPSRLYASPSPDGGSAAPILRGFAFFEARGCVDHFEFILGRGVLALVGHHADRGAARALSGLVHEQLQFLLASF
jgi:hypothetical protein